MEASHWAEFGRRLHRAYTQAGFSRASFARALEAGYATVWRWEQGKSQPKFESLVAISEALPGDTFPGLFDGLPVDGATSAIIERARAVDRQAQEHKEAIGAKFQPGIDGERAARLGAGLPVRVESSGCWTVESLRSLVSGIEWSPKNLDVLVTVVMGLEAVHQAQECRVLLRTIASSDRDAAAIAEQELEALIPDFVASVKKLVAS